MFRVFAGFLFLMFLPLFASHCNLENEIQSDTISEPVPDPAHNSQNSLDWAGTYRGITTCADCEGIYTILTLTYDKTFELSLRYLDESNERFKTSGTFSWNSSGTTITLDVDENLRPSQYIVQENRLVQLNMSGEEIKGELASRYILDKTFE